MNIVSIIGLIGGILTSIGGIPQIIKMITTKQTNDLSWTMIMLWFVGLVFTLSYGIVIHQIPIILSGILSLISTITMLILKIYYEIIINKYKILDNINNI
jgi:MtN3 and saliva related transmembrane protein